MRLIVARGVVLQVPVQLVELPKECLISSIRATHASEGRLLWECLWVRLLWIRTWLAMASSQSCYLILHLLLSHHVRVSIVCNSVSLPVNCVFKTSDLFGHVEFHSSTTSWRGMTLSIILRRCLRWWATHGV